MIWLKAVVTLLTVLIVLALGLIGYGFFKKTTDPEWKLLEGDEPPSLAKPFADINLDLPPGCIILQVNSADAFAYLTIGPGQSCNRVIVLDLRSGRLLGTIKARP